MRSSFLSLPSRLLIAVCCGIPLGWIVYVVALHPAASIGDIWLTPFRWRLLGRTLAYNGLAAVIALLLGIPVGWQLGRGRGVRMPFLWLLVPTALFMPSLAFAYGWSQVVRGGDPIFRRLGITFFPGSISDIARCVWTLASWLWAVPACVIGLSLRRMDANVQQQALLDGGLKRVLLRQMLGPICISVAAVTVLATQEFSVYEPTGISVVATEVRMVFDTGAFSSIANPINAPGITSSAAPMSPDQPRRAAAAVATTLPLMAVTFALAGAIALAGRRFNEDADAIAVEDWPAILNAPLWTAVATLLVIAVNILLPIAALVGSLRIPFSPVRIIEEFAPPVTGSAIVALCTLAVAVVITLSASAALKPARWSLIAAIASFLIGGQLVAIALIRAFNPNALRWVFDSWVISAIVYIARFGWLSLLASRVTFGRRWRELRELASLDGASPFQTASQLIWPLAWPTLAAGAILVGALSMTEVPATVLLSPQHPQVLTPLLMGWVHLMRSDPMIEAALLMIALTIGPAFIAVLLVQVGRRAFARG